MKFNRTSEGIEFDLATSFLSRYVLLKYLTFDQTTRIFVMGYPGLFIEPVSMGDINFESMRDYSFSRAHFNTHIFNEAMVLHYAQKSFQIFGLAPGIVLSDGFRTVSGGGLVEKILSLLGFPTQQAYARNVIHENFKNNNS
jgi:hypothetical protein